MSASSKLSSTGTNTSNTISSSCKQRNNSQEVKINVGIVSGDENGNLRKTRGTKIPVLVHESFTAEKVLQTAVKKIAENNQYFCSLDSYALIYPDFRIVKHLPGTNTNFTLGAYKHYLGKPFLKIDLYVCLLTDLLKSPREISSPSASDNDSNGQIDDKVDDSKKLFGGNQLPVIPTLLQHDSDNITTKNVTPISGEINDELKYPVSPALDLVDLVDEYADIKHIESVQPQATCPICGKKFGISDIEEHANDCLNSQQTSFNILQNSLLPKSTDNQCNKPEETQQKELTGNKEQHIVFIKEKISQFLLDGGNSVELRVRRGFEFVDFLHFFNKKYNMAKIGTGIKIKYIGEDGIDDGGVAREFYTGKYLIAP